MIAFIIRTKSDEQGTSGWFITSTGFYLRSLELPWKDNRVDRSCIPTGDYRAKFLERSASGKYRRVYHLESVPSRSGILIHSGNFAGDIERGFKSDVRGCILLGKRAGLLSDQRAVLASRLALTELNHALRGEDFELRIRDNF